MSLMDELFTFGTVSAAFPPPLITVRNVTSCYPISWHCVSDCAKMVEVVMFAL